MTTAAPTIDRAIRITDDPRWTAVKTRDRTADGTFVYSVSTTGVFCRPSCPSRLAKPEHVRFHPTTAAAKTAGFRPCKRCKPAEDGSAQPHLDKVTAACRLIETSVEPPTLDALATRAGLSPFHFHRVFKTITGLTPRAYAQAHRGARVRRALDGGGTVTRAIYEAGYQSSGRFYADAGRLLGMTPTDYRAGGIRTEIRFTVGSCSLGAILVATTDRGVCSVLLGDDPKRLATDLRARFPRAGVVEDGGLDRLVTAAIALVDAPGAGLDLPLDVRGTAFQHRVWRALREIPSGTTATYAEIAQRIGAPKAVRAVASACAANAVAIAIPCHRVVRGDGDLAGYRWGVERKRSLLAREGTPPRRTVKRSRPGSTVRRA